jgi:hypothetical protein
MSRLHSKFFYRSLSEQKLRNFTRKILPHCAIISFGASEEEIFWVVCEKFNETKKFFSERTVNYVIENSQFASCKKWSWSVVAKFYWKNGKIEMWLFHFQLCSFFSKIFYFHYGSILNFLFSETEWKMKQKIHYNIFTQN